MATSAGRTFFYLRQTANDKRTQPPEIGRLKTPCNPTTQCFDERFRRVADVLQPSLKWTLQIPIDASGEKAAVDIRVLPTKGYPRAVTRVVFDGEKERSFCGKSFLPGRLDVAIAKALQLQPDDFGSRSYRRLVSRCHLT